jgi:hypothetical protein
VEEARQLGVCEEGLEGWLFEPKPEGHCVRSFQTMLPVAGDVEFLFVHLGCVSVPEPPDSNIAFQIKCFSDRWHWGPIINRDGLLGMDPWWGQICCS